MYSLEKKDLATIHNDRSDLLLRPLVTILKLTADNVNQFFNSYVPTNWVHNMSKGGGGRTGVGISWSYANETSVIIVYLFPMSSACIVQQNLRVAFNHSVPEEFVSKLRGVFVRKCWMEALPRSTFIPSLLGDTAIPIVIPLPLS